MATIISLLFVTAQISQILFIRTKTRAYYRGKEKDYPGFISGFLDLTFFEKVIIVSPFNIKYCSSKDLKKAKLLRAVTIIGLVAIFLILAVVAVIQGNVPK